MKIIDRISKMKFKDKVLHLDIHQKQINDKFKTRKLTRFKIQNHRSLEAVATIREMRT